MSSKGSKKLGPAEIEYLRARLREGGMLFPQKRLTEGSKYYRRTEETPFIWFPKVKLNQYGKATERQIWLKTKKPFLNENDPKIGWLFQKTMNSPSLMCHGSVKEPNRK